jgi:hypothetical protein
MYVPGAVDVLLRIVIPVAIFVLALFLTWVVEKRYTKSLLAVYLAFVLTDAVLSLAICGVNFKGAF